MKKMLYRVKIENYVMATDQLDAINVAITNCDESCVTEADKAHSVPTEWKHAVPFGSDDDQTCHQVLMSM